MLLDDIPAADRELYAHLGLMVRMAADLELRLHMVATAMSDSPYSHLWINGLSSSAATKMIKDIAEINPRVRPEQRAILEDLLKQIDRLYERRHAYVHGGWSMNGVDRSEPELQAMRYTRRKPVPRFDPISAADLEDLIRGFHAAIQQLMAWLVEFLQPTQQGA